MTTDNHPILLFDGVCNLCNGLVQWVLARDKRKHIRFASLQSEQGQDLQREYGLNPAALDSLVYVKDGKAYTKSSAALLLGQELGGIYQAARLGWIVPSPIRDWVYDWVARNRYRWFGKAEACWLPRPEWQERFLG